MPDSNLSLANFDEIAYSVENFTKEKKIRDIGLVGIDAFKVGRFFSTLPRKYSQININSISKEVNEHIQQIEKFFTGSQSVEFYSNWLNYVYFLVITERNSTLKAFIAKVKKQINALKANSLDKGMYSKPMTINRHAKDYLLAHLEVCIKVALCLNSSLANKHFSSIVPLVSKYRNANMFEHSLVTFPLANYLDYERDVSFCKMSMNDLGKYPDKIEESFKFVWSPRFIHYDELLLLLFYHYHRLNKNGADYKYSTVRDLHAFVVQANTSFFGDSRVTGPYDRDSKDIFKIKGGDNDHVVIGTVNFGKYKKFQQNYYSDFDKKLKIIEKERKKKKPSYPKKARNKPDIKPLSARFKIIK